MPDNMIKQIPEHMSEQAKKEIANFLAGMREADTMADLFESRGQLDDAKRKSDDADWYWNKAIQRGYVP